MNVNDKIQLVRFYARFGIALVAMSIFSYVVHVMLTSSHEISNESVNLLNILIGAFIPILAGIARFYFESGGDLSQEDERNIIPPSKPPNGEEDESSIID